MNTLLQAFLAGAIIENILFARALGADDLIRRTDSYSRAGWFGLASMLVSLPAGALSWACLRLFGGAEYWAVIRFAVYLSCCVLSYLLAYFALQRLRIPFPPPQGGIVTAAALNCAAYGPVLLAMARRGAFPETMLYLAGCAVGLSAAMMLVHAGRERLEISSVPRAFAGLPIIMIYIGILSLAIYGLIGHQLPT